MRRGLLAGAGVVAWVTAWMVCGRDRLGTTRTPGTVLDDVSCESRRSELLVTTNLNNMTGGKECAGL